MAVPEMSQHRSNRAVMLRLPIDVVAQLQTIADREDRSLSGQILHIVKRYFKEQENAGNDAG